ncbi:MAG: resuscitation-promoting factor RpfB [Frankiales bacterium]|nr:resuscitation-promoting factor RpfB [Frankiales bacterium]
MNRISVRGAAVATAMASTSLLVASGLTAWASDNAGAGTPAASGPLVAVASPSWTSRLEPSQPARRTPAAAPAHRASRSLQRTHLAPRQLGKLLAAERGWKGEQWSCLDKLWTRESNWQVHAANARSGAYGIPQSLPARKMAAFGDDWRTNARTQIRWGLSYIDRSYGTPCRAWHHSLAHGYY